MKKYDGISIDDIVSPYKYRDKTIRRLAKRKLTGIETEEFEELAAKLKPCPFCGGGFRFFKETKTYDNGDRLTIQYYLHDGKVMARDYCVLHIIEPFTLAGGDARPEEGRIGEAAEMWNRRFTGCFDREGEMLYTGDIVEFEDAKADYEGYHDDVFDNRGVVEIAPLSGTFFTNRQTVDMDDLFYELPTKLDCIKIGDMLNNPERADLEEEDEC